MHIIVCIKQVPDTASVRINPETNTLMREGVESILNPFDEYALEVALQFKDARGARVTALTMGPPQADAVLREALARGADDGVLLTDRAFAGADTLATSRVLALAVRKICARPDLVLFGKQAIDGDTAQVGPGVAEFLGLPLVSYVRAFRLADDVFTAETQTDEGCATVEGRLPAVLTVVKEAAVPRFASLGGWMAAKRGAVARWGAGEIGADPAECGLSGSPTKVVKIFAPPTKTGGVRMDGREDPAAAVQALMKVLGEKGVA